MEDSFETEVSRLWDSTVGSIGSKLETFRLGLYRWEKQIKQARRGIKEKLTQRLEALIEADRDKENLSELIETKLHLNMEIEKDELY